MIFKMTLEKEINQGNPESDELWWCPECKKRTLKEVEEYFWSCPCGYNENEEGINRKKEYRRESK